MGSWPPARPLNGMVPRCSPASDSSGTSGKAGEVWPAAAILTRPFPKTFDEPRNEPGYILRTTRDSSIGAQPLDPHALGLSDGDGDWEPLQRGVDDRKITNARTFDPDSDRARGLLDGSICGSCLASSSRCLAACESPPSRGALRHALLGLPGRRCIDVLDFSAADSIEGHCVIVPT